MTDQQVILVVDDEEPIRRIFQRAFETQGYRVLTASEGEEALALLRAERPAVIFLDLWMPRITGIELCRAIRQRQPISILHAVTGYGSLFDLVECREAGFDDYFTKPVELATILKAASDAFEKIARWGTCGSQRPPTGSRPAAHVADPAKAGGTEPNGKARGKGHLIPFDEDATDDVPGTS